MNKTIISFFRLSLVCLVVLLGSQNIALAKEVKLIRVHKAERLMELYTKTIFGREKLLKSYKISLGKNPIGHKQQEGDSRTPEGKYKISFKNPNSSFYLSLHISYPNQVDQQRAWDRGVSPGGDIFIHGMPNAISHLFRLVPNSFNGEPEEWVYNFLSGMDWTEGCIAVRNDEMKEIYQLVNAGTDIEILP